MACPYDICSCPTCVAVGLISKLIRAMVHIRPELNSLACHMPSWRYVHRLRNEMRAASRISAAMDGRETGAAAVLLACRGSFQ